MDKEEEIEEGYGVFIQERESTEEDWEEAYDAELYDIYSSRKEADIVKKELMEKRENKRLQRIFVKKMTEEEMMFV
jgi:hypothetical protein